MLQIFSHCGNTPFCTVCIAGVTTSDAATPAGNTTGAAAPATTTGSVSTNMMAIYAGSGAFSSF